jgi:hypothetical protein
VSRTKKVNYNERYLFVSHIIFVYGRSIMDKNYLYNSKFILPQQSPSTCSRDAFWEKIAILHFDSQRGLGDSHPPAETVQIFMHG